VATRQPYDEPRKARDDASDGEDISCKAEQLVLVSSGFEVITEHQGGEVQRE
jgi:hypothetical protein